MAKRSQKYEDIGIIVNSLRSIKNCAQKQSFKLMKSYKITGPQLGVLRMASDHPQISLKELSEYIYLHVSTVSGIVDRLVMAGYLSRLRDTKDRRMVKIRLTEKGAKLIEKVPISSFGNMIKELEKMPGAQVHAISKSIATLSRLIMIDMPQ